MGKNNTVLLTKKDVGQKFTGFTADSLVDVQGFGRCCVIGTNGHWIEVQGADGFVFKVHRQLVQDVKRTGSLNQEASR